MEAVKMVIFSTTYSIGCKFLNVAYYSSPPPTPHEVVIAPCHKQHKLKQNI